MSWYARIVLSYRPITRIAFPGTWVGMLLVLALYCRKLLEFGPASHRSGSPLVAVRFICVFSRRFTWFAVSPSSSCALSHQQIVPLAVPLAHRSTVTAVVPDGTLKVSTSRVSPSVQSAWVMDGDVYVLDPTVARRNASGPSLFAYPDRV